MCFTPGDELPRLRLVRRLQREDQSAHGAAGGRREDPFVGADGAAGEIYY